MEKKVSIKNLKTWSTKANLYGLSFDSEKLFGLTIDNKNSIEDKICEIAKRNKEKIVFDFYGDVTKEYIDVTKPTELYYSLIDQGGLPVAKLNEKHKEYLDSLFGIFCNNINCYRTGIIVLFLDGYYSKKKNFKKTEEYLISIQSSSDVITNSSSELFSIVSSKSSSDLYKLLRTYSDINDANSYSGNGGDIDIYEVDFSSIIKTLYGDQNPNINIDNINKKFIEIYKECFELPKEGTLFKIDIDHGFTNTMKFIENDLKGKIL